MARHYGMPYMGSKQKLVDGIVPFILKRHPETTDFYDLFGGGGSVSLYTVLKYPNLTAHYNELSTAIGGLMVRLRDGGEISFDFVTMDQFKRAYKGDDWYAGLLQSCWTFGNNQKSYLYGKDLEKFKHELHLAVVDGKQNFAWLEDFVKSYIEKVDKREVNPRIYLDPKRYSTPYQRRMVLQRQLDRLGVLQHLARLERLIQIQNMPGISDLQITVGKSYDQIQISGNKPLIYCDPPYEGTAEYQEGDFNHKLFYEWVMAQPYPVYVSSYRVSDDRLKRIKAINTRSLMNTAFDEAKYNYENIYWNGVQ